MRVPLLLRPLLLLNSVAGQCDEWCGKWACPFDYCSMCAPEQCIHDDEASGTPVGHPIASFLDMVPRKPPTIAKTAKRLPGVRETDSWDVQKDGALSGEPALEVAFDMQAAHSYGFSAFHLGTNLPTADSKGGGRKF